MKISDKAADAHRDIGDRSHRKFQQVVRNFHDVVNLVQVNEGIAQSSRHLGIDLSDHGASAFRGCFRSVHSDAEAAEPVFVGR